jgi:hypothetical protein
MHRSAGGQENVEKTDWVDEIEEALSRYEYPLQMGDGRDPYEDIENLVTAVRTLRWMLKLQRPPE